MDRPKEAIKWLRMFSEYTTTTGRCPKDLLAYLDWLEGKHVCEWPKELTRERLNSLANMIDTTRENAWETWPAQEGALRALAAIAPQKKKRMVNLWDINDGGEPIVKPADWAPRDDTKWDKVGGPFEIDA